VVQLSEFELREDTGVWMPPGSGRHTAFAYSDGTDEETRILNAVTLAADVRDNSSALTAFVSDWPSYYHLAPGRSNAIRSLDLPRDLSVLELGAGCGALARHLGENHTTVHSVEGSARRATICRARCRGLSNVKVFCADFSDLTCAAAYDVVLLNGVLEYAPSFFQSGDRGHPVEVLLALAKSALKPDGVVLIAIENKLGLKYWAGAPEDHTATNYEGIHGYPATTKVTTFSKREIRSVLNRSGFPAIGCFHCFPDYKFASTVLSDEVPPGMYLANWLDYPAECPGLPRDHTIHEGLAAKSLYDAGLLGEFANSFLIAGGTDEAERKFRGLFQPAWIARRLSVRGRDRAHHRITTLAREDNRLVVTKTVVRYDAGTDAPSLKTIDWTPGDLLMLEMSRAMLASRPDDAVHVLLEEYHQALLTQFATGERDSEGYPLVSGRCVDFLMRNIIRSPAGLTAIDLEWEAAEPLTADFILFRSLWHDALGPNHAWATRRIADFDLYIVRAIQRFYPQYGFGRQARNRAQEERFLAGVSDAAAAAPARGNGALWMAGKAWGRTLTKRIRDTVGRT
jgi:SAM-dependent methyltransferase